MKKKHKGILVRLAVVAGVLLILGILLYPLLMRAREEARRAVCKSNIKQIGLLWKMYSSDYDEVNFMRADKFLELFQADLATDSNIFICPSSGTKPGDPSDVDKWSDYAMRPVTDINPDGLVGSVPWAYCKHGHDGGTNVLYGDGHVAWMKWEYVKKTP